MSRRWRNVLLVVAGLAAAALLAAVIGVYWLLQPDRFTTAMQAQASALGLELNLASPASPTLFPRPALELQGITLNERGASMPILLAARGRLALPWRTLLGGPTVITRLEIDAPRVDLDALQGWLSRLPASDSSRPPQIPRIDTGILISRASLVRGNDILLENLALETGQLMPGEPFSLDVTARDGSGDPVLMRLLTTPRMSGASMQFQNIALHLSHGASATIDLRGSARWHGAADAAADLTGTLDSANAGRYELAMQLTPATTRDPLLLRLKLDGPGNHANLELPPLALAGWWSQLSSEKGPQLTIPPGRGHVEVDKASFGNVAVEGLRLDIGDDVPAGAGSSAGAQQGP
ncbi:membrane assembly protein AsmA [Dyella sp.]|jgi:AsmA protein|uniref:membrane assembly protein AsmA n=1 Tax=Dyella sp. TaxID=1869338 RepID=UPI002D78BBC6|nr:membrane assembly protein AsmA [Dyella sp.]HET6433648.1 membrane assembly protein AsmA [Dyella sp.]